MWGDTLNTDVGIVWMFISVLFFFLGMYVGVKIRENDDVKIYRPKPKPEDIRIVLENMRFGLHCSPFEKDCIDEAIRIVEGREEDESQMDSQRD